MKEYEKNNAELFSGEIPYRPSLSTNVKIPSPSLGLIERKVLLPKPSAT